MTRKITNEVCPFCGHDVSHERTHSEDIDFRGLALELSGIPESVCNRCGRSWKNDSQRAAYRQLIRDAYSSARETIRDNQGLLSGDEIKSLRESLKLTQREAADLFGGGPNAFNKYESGEILQSAAMDRLMRLSYALGSRARKFLQLADQVRPGRAIPRAVTLIFEQEGLLRSRLRASVSISKTDAQVIAPIGMSETGSGVKLIRFRVKPLETKYAGSSGSDMAQAVISMDVASIAKANVLPGHIIEHHDTSTIANRHLHSH